MTAREEHEEAFRELIGRTLHGVQYLGAWPIGPNEAGAYIEWVELAMDRSVTYRITTEPDFGDYGVVVMEGNVAPGSLLKIFDAGGVPPWTTAVGRQVVSVKVLWRPLSYESAASAGEEPEFPREVALSFNDGTTVVLSAAAANEQGEWVLGVDNLSVLDEAQARGLGML